MIERTQDISDEVALLRLAKAGDDDAFAALMASLEPAIARFVRRLIGAGADADDIVQDTFVALYVNLQRIEPEATLRPYVYRIARNRSYDVLRRSQRRDEQSIDEDEDDAVQVRIAFDLADEHPTPEDAAGWLLMYLQVREAIDVLPDLQRQALILFAEEGLSYQEIAEVMDVSIGTIKSRLFHAKKNLRDRLGDTAMDSILEALDEA